MANMPLEDILQMGLRLRKEQATCYKQLTSLEKDIQRTNHELLKIDAQITLLLLKADAHDSSPLRKSVVYLLNNDDSGIIVPVTQQTSSLKISDS